MLKASRQPQWALHAWKGFHVNRQTFQTQRRYDRVAPFYDAMEVVVERRFFRNLREQTLWPLTGRILEVGVGTGKNLPYYTFDAEVTGIDISPRMLSRAIRRRAELGLPVELLRMDAQRMAFASATFDHVVGTFVLCSIPDPIQAVAEMRRVLKPSGNVMLIEHVRSGQPVIAALQQLHDPITSRLAGFHVNRDTRLNIQSGGLTIVKDEHLALGDIFRRFTCTKGE